MAWLQYERKSHDDPLSQYIMTDTATATSPQQLANVVPMHCIRRQKLVESAGISWSGKSLFLDHQNTQVNKETYIFYLQTSLLPECHHIYPAIDFVFMQGSVSQGNSGFSSKRRVLKNGHHTTRLETFRLFTSGHLARTCV